MNQPLQDSPLQHAHPGQRGPVEAALRALVVVRVRLHAADLQALRLRAPLALHRRSAHLLLLVPRRAIVTGRLLPDGLRPRYDPNDQLGPQHEPVRLAHAAGEIPNTVWREVEGAQRGLSGRERERSEMILWALKLKETRTQFFLSKTGNAEFSRFYR